MVYIAKKRIKDEELEETSLNISDIDKIIHEPARLLIVSLLYVVEEMDFVFLRNQTKLRDGNLSFHMSKLEEVGYVNVEKKFKGKKPQTLFRLTEEGRKAFEVYREKMAQVLNP